MIRRPPRSPQTHTLSLHDALPIERRTRSFGWTYDFATGRFAPADAIPDWLTECRERAAQFAGIAPEQLVQALLIAYAPGAGIGWHRDSPVLDHVIGLSLGAPVTLRLRRRAGAGFQRSALDRKSVGLGMSASVSLDIGGCRLLITNI